MTTYRMGDAEVRLFTANADSDLAHFLGGFAEFALPGQPTAMWREAGADWCRTPDTLASLRDRDYLMHEATPESLDPLYPEVFAGLRHRLEQVALARRLAAEAHAGRVDRNGERSIEHPAQVAARVDHLLGQAVGWLHDVVEDTPLGAGDLLAAGVDRAVVDAVLLLTRRPDVPGDRYYGRIAADPVALEVKLADLADNTDPARTARLDPGVRDRLAAKYAHARRALGAGQEQA